MQGVNLVWILIQTYQQKHVLWERKKTEHRGIQGMRLQNMAPWHIECFKLKQFEKWQMLEGLSDLLP